MTKKNINTTKATPIFVETNCIDTVDDVAFEFALGKLIDVINKGLLTVNDVDVIFKRVCLIYRYKTFIYELDDMVSQAAHNTADILKNFFETPKKENIFKRSWNRFKNIFKKK